MNKLNIEYARCMTAAESKEFFYSLIRRSNNKINSYQTVLQKNEAELVAAYHRYAQEMANEDILLKIEYQKRVNSYNNGVCTCGLPVKLIPNFNFYGCQNYRSPGEHINYIERENPPYKRNPLNASSYVTKILYDLGLKNSLNSKALNNFYFEMGFEDLCLKYNKRPYDKTINTYTNIKKAASEFEKLCVEQLKKQYPIVIPQLGIIYKLKGEKESKCFIDALCSNDKEVHIIECKTSEWDAREDQETLYINLINHIENRGREIKFTYLFERINKSA